MVSKRPPGNPNHNLPPGPGRPPGSKNRSQFLAKEYMDWRNFSPIDELILWYQDESHPADTRVRALSELLDRYSPKLKSVTVEHHGAQALSNVQINIISAPTPAPGQVIDAVATPIAAIPHIETLTPVDAVTSHEWANLQKETPPNAWDQDQDEDESHDRDG